MKMKMSEYIGMSTGHTHTYIYIWNESIEISQMRWPGEVFLARTTTRRLREDPHTGVGFPQKS